MAVSDVEVVGGWRTQTSSETRPWAFDLTAEMDLLDVPTTAGSELTDLLTGASFPTGLIGVPAVSATAPHIVQTVSGLAPGRNYRLVITVAMGGSKETATVLQISCPY